MFAFLTVSLRSCSYSTTYTSEHRDEALKENTTAHLVDMAEDSAFSQESNSWQNPVTSLRIDGI